MPPKADAPSILALFRANPGVAFTAGQIMLGLEHLAEAKFPDADPLATVFPEIIGALTALERQSKVVESGWVGGKPAWMLK